MVPTALWACWVHNKPKLSMVLLVILDHFLVLEGLDLGLQDLEDHLVLGGHHLVPGGHLGVLPCMALCMVPCMDPGHTL